MQHKTQATKHGSRKLVSQIEAGQYAGVDERTIRRWVANGHLPGYRIGPRLMRVDLNDIDAMLRAIPSGDRA